MPSFHRCLASPRGRPSEDGKLLKQLPRPATTGSGAAMDARRLHAVFLQEQKMFEAIMQIPSLVQTQADILDEIRSLRSDQRAIELKVTDLAVKVERAEGFASSPFVVIL
ncbi:hypothetical protein HPB52_023150 [Rhipicephalus sanguineus]|uniref:Uncharacterized protein n=1 Tax=Rhipicephalus sanguineus TaxID=34632 RepID=A0A9D4SZS5_RHISA|nr:hypothetical protein HPB52_023150 [Rhipicephalus sanguineus]